MTFLLPNPFDALVLLPLLARRRLRPEELPRSPTRAKILKIVGDHPGMSSRRLVRTLGLTWGTVCYHIDRLVETGHLEETKVGRSRYLRLPGVPESEDASWAVSSEAARRVATAILRHPGADVKHLAEHAGLSVRVTYYHVRHLVDAKLVTTSQRTRHKDLSPTPALRELLRDMEDVR